MCWDSAASASKGQMPVLSAVRVKSHSAGDPDLGNVLLPAPATGPWAMPSSEGAAETRGLPPSSGFVSSTRSLKRRSPRPRFRRRSSSSPSLWRAGPGRWSAAPSSGGPWEPRSRQGVQAGWDASASGRGGRAGGWPCLLAQPVTPALPFPSLLQTISTQFRQAPEQSQDGQPWTLRLVQFADSLLNHSRNVTPLTPFSAQQRQAWDR